MMLIADAGNSKTDWSFVSRDNKTLVIQTSGVSPYFDSDQNIVANFREAFQKLGSPKADKIVFFGTGCLFGNQQLRISDALKTVFASASIIKVSDDLTGAAIALFGNGEGIAVISGTGSNAGVYKKNTIAERVDSLGYLLGDEGSGADIGFRFLKAVLSGRLPENVSNHFFDYTGKDKAGVLSFLYSESRPQAFAASVLPFIKQYDEIPSVKSLIIESFSSMADKTVSPLINKYPDLPVGFCGGVADLFRAELLDVMECKEIKIKKIIQQPMQQLVEYFVRKSSTYEL